MVVRNFLTLVLFVFLSCGDSGGSVPDTNMETPELSVANVILVEGNDNRFFNFQVSINIASENDVEFNYRTEEDTAVEGEDYIPDSGKLIIPVGQRNTVVAIEVVGDDIKEGDETFKVILSDAINADLANPIATGTIRNDDTKVVVPEEGYITPESYPGYTLNWQEEFEGNQLNTSEWNYEIGNNGWGNNELQYYTDSDDNSFMQDGNLVIKAIKENFNGAPYTSARLTTQNKKVFTHGRIDVRAILPEGQGIWPAIWMLGNNFSTIGWPACGEIDIMELIGHEPSKVHGTAHWGPQGQSWSHHQGAHYSLSGGEKFSEKYHVFSIIWETDVIKWYVDDNLYYTINRSDVNGSYPFNMDFFFILNIAVGGNWPGNPDGTTQFPQIMVVDYIRVFDKN